MTTQFTYNQEQAVKGGQPLFISETGAYVVKILAAKYTRSQKGALALEFAVETDDGLKGDYISVFYQSGNGEPIQSGHNMIQAIMGCTGVKELNIRREGEDDLAPELKGKKVGLVLQKVLYTKNNGQDGYRFQIVCPFGAGTGKTLAEHLDNRPAERVDYLRATLKDKDERDKQQTAYSAQHQYYASTAPATTAPVENFDDDSIPF